MPNLRSFPATIGLILLSALSITLPAIATAQWGPRVVTLESELNPTEGLRGSEVRLAVTVTLDPEYHIYAMVQPVSLPGPGPVPTSIRITEGEDVLLLKGAWEEPEPVRKWDEGFERDTDVHYDSPHTYTATFIISPDIEPGTHTIEGTFRYQACTDTGCLPPMNITFEHVLEVLEGDPIEVDVSSLQEDADAGADDPVAVVGETSRSTSPSYTDDTSGLGFGAFLLFAFLFGIAALATPCVFPMIPITITFFTNKASKSTGQAALYAGTYVLSIIAGFTLIGFGISLILLALGGGVESSGFANRMAANPWVNSFFALLYIAFALALFGVFELRLPTSWSAKMNQGAMKSSGFVSIFFKAMVFVIISFTCTAPLLGVLIVQAMGGEWTRPLFGMMAFSAGFAAPFFFLALAPQMMSNLPKAGDWLYTVKIVMGLVVLAAAFKFVSNADLIWLRESMIFTPEVLLAVWAVIALTTAIYLFGMIRMGDDNTTVVGPMRVMLGMTFATVGLYLASGMFGGKLHPWIEAYLPPNLREEAMSIVVAEGGNPGARTATGGDRISSGFSWFTELEPALEHARNIGRNVFIDFTGYTCTNCRLMEKNMFPRTGIADRLDQFVRVKLYTDDPTVGERNLRFQAETFETVTLPFYVVMTPDQEVLATEVYTTNESRFAAFLDRGLETAETPDTELAIAK